MTSPNFNPTNGWSTPSWMKKTKSPQSVSVSTPVQFPSSSLYSQYEPLRLTGADQFPSLSQVCPNCTSEHGCTCVMTLDGNVTSLTGGRSSSSSSASSSSSSKKEEQEEYPHEPTANQLIDSKVTKGLTGDDEFHVRVHKDFEDHFGPSDMSLEMEKCVRMIPMKDGKIFSHLSDAASGQKDVSRILVSIDDGSYQDFDRDDIFSFSTENCLDIYTGWRSGITAKIMQEFKTTKSLLMLDLTRRQIRRMCVVTPVTLRDCKSCFPTYIVHTGSINYISDLKASNLPKSYYVSRNIPSDNLNMNYTTLDGWKIDSLSSKLKCYDKVAHQYERATEKDLTLISTFLKSVNEQICDTNGSASQLYWDPPTSELENLIRNGSVYYIKLEDSDVTMIAIFVMRYKTITLPDSSGIIHIAQLSYHSAIKDIYISDIIRMACRICKARDITSLYGYGYGQLLTGYAREIVTYRPDLKYYLCSNDIHFPSDLSRMRIPIF